MSLEKPRSIERSPFKSAKWDEITKGRNFTEANIPELTLLCQWYQVVDKCMADLSNDDDDIQVAYANDYGDVKALPQLSTMKQASAEIRALNKQLGINDEAIAEQPKIRETPANVIQTKRFARASHSRTA